MRRWAKNEVRESLIRISVLLFMAVLMACFAEGSFQTPSFAANQEISPENITASDLIGYAYKENPSIQEAREAWKAVVEDYRLATGYPDPELNFTYFPEPVETRLGPQDWNITLTQRIPFPGKLTQAGKVVEVEARIAHLRLDKTVRAVVAAIKGSFYELLYIRTAERVAGENLKILQHLRKVAETGSPRDRTVLMDMVRAQSQLGQLRYDGLLLADLEFTEITRLNGLLNRPPDAPIGKLLDEGVKPLRMTLAELYHLAETQQEQIRISEAIIDREGARKDLADYENLPDFKVGFSYSGIGEPDVPVKPSGAGRDAVGVQVGVTIPLWFDKNEGRVGRAKAEIRKAQAARTGTINESRTEIHAVYFHVQNSRRLMTLYEKDLLPQAIKAMEIAETWYREGQSTFSDFLETQSVVYNFQLSLARARSDYGKYLARLEQLTGQSLTGRKDAAPHTDKEEKP